MKEAKVTKSPILHIKSPAQLSHERDRKKDRKIGKTKTATQSVNNARGNSSQPGKFQVSKSIKSNRSQQVAAK